MIRLDSSTIKVLAVVYDNDSFINWFPHGLSYLISYANMRFPSAKIDVYAMDVEHHSEQKLKSFLDQHHYDVVAVGVIAGYYQYKKLLEISEAINSSTNRPPLYVLGGHGPSPESEFFLNKTGADVVVQGEGEETFAEILEMYGSRDMFKILGTVWNNGGTIIKNKRRPLISDVDALPFPAWHQFDIDYYRMVRMPHADNTDFCFPVLSGRGCRFNCNFCFRLDKGFRPRSSEMIMEEIRFLNKRYGVNYIIFSDELLMSSVDRTLELCETFSKSNLKFKWWCEGRLNYASKEVLSAMKSAGCVFVNYGIESYDNDMLKVMKKGLNVDQIKTGIENTIDVGISPGFNIIFGNIGETKEVLWKGVEFLRKYTDYSQLRTIRPVTPYPGSPLYYYAIEKGLLSGPADFYENKHLNSDLLAVNFTNMSDSEVHSELNEANKLLIGDYMKRKTEELIKQTEDLYLGKDCSFRGYRRY